MGHSLGGLVAIKVAEQLVQAAKDGRQGLGVPKQVSSARGHAWPNKPNAGQARRACRWWDCHGVRFVPWVCPSWPNLRLASSPQPRPVTLAMGSSH